MLRRSVADGTKSIGRGESPVFVYGRYFVTALSRPYLGPIQRGGMSYDRLRSYMGLIKFQSDAGSLYNKMGDLNWDVVDLKQFHVMSHKNEAGLQLADSVAGAFFQAVSLNDRGECFPEYAKNLEPRLYRGPGGRIMNYGVKHAPWTLSAMHLQPRQLEIFKHLIAMESGGRHPAPLKPL